MFKTTPCPYLVDLFGSSVFRQTTVYKGRSIGYSTSMDIRITHDHGAPIRQLPPHLQAR